MCQILFLTQSSYCLESHPSLKDLHFQPLQNPSQNHRIRPPPRIQRYIHNRHKRLPLYHIDHPDTDTRIHRRNRAQDRNRLQNRRGLQDNRRRSVRSRHRGCRPGPRSSRWPRWWRWWERAVRRPGRVARVDEDGWRGDGVDYAADGRHDDVCWHYAVVRVIWPVVS